MACNLDDPELVRARNDILGNTSNWLIVTYRPNSKDDLTFSSQGNDGLEGLKVKLTQNEAQFALLRMDNSYLLITFTPDIIGGVRRSRAMVHSRAVGAFFQVSHSSLNVNAVEELTLSAVRSKLSLEAAAPLPPPPSHPQRTLRRVSGTQFESTNSTQQQQRSSLKQEARQEDIISTEKLKKDSLPPPPAPSKETPQKPKRPVPSPPEQEEVEKDSQGFVSSPKSKESYDNATKSSSSPPPRTESPLPDTSRSSTPSIQQQQQDKGPHTPTRRSHDLNRAVSSAASSVASSPLDKQRPRPPRTSSFDHVKSDRNTPSPVAFPSTSPSDRHSIMNGSAGRTSYDAEILSPSERKEEEIDAQQRKEAAERLAREVLRQKENEAKRAAAEETERQRKIEEEKHLLELEQKQLKEEQQIKFKTDLKRRFENEPDLDAVMIKGYVTVQGGNSLLWRRRWFELFKNRIVFYKSDSDTSKYVDQIVLSPNGVKAITVDPEEATVAHAFKLDFVDSEQDSYLFYCDEHDDKEVLIAGIKCGAGLNN